MEQHNRTTPSLRLLPGKECEQPLPARVFTLGAHVNEVLKGGLRGLNMAHPVTASPSSWHQSKSFVKSYLLPRRWTEAGKHELRKGQRRRGLLNVSGDHNKSQRKSGGMLKDTRKSKSQFCKQYVEKKKCYFGVWSGDSASQSSLKGYSWNISVGSVGKDKRKEPRSLCSQLTPTEWAGSRAKVVATLAVLKCEEAKT